ncbi:hypothetical protein NW757_013176 [Fusarium falciforme]|nr:hypothetical protein NW757_013176 [Fusarium falciforme]
MERPINRGLTPLIVLSDMVQRREIRATDEDWTGTTSRARRRKLQNRLNQRAYGAQGALRQFAKKAYEDYVLGCPQPWHLSTLIQVNVFNALVHNGFTLGFSDHWQSRAATSPFAIIGPGPSWDSYPPSLRPTALQRTVPHHPWIDLFPIPQMRDNILRSFSRLDMDDLCGDLLDVKPGLDGKPNLIVWGDPWDPRGWEPASTLRPH